MNEKQKKINKYEDFWVFYLSEHSHPWTIHIHVWGTISSILLAIVLWSQGVGMAVLLCLGIAYGLNWISHFFIEKNLPATFRYPVWSFVSDFKLIQCYFLGKLDSNRR